MPSSGVVTSDSVKPRSCLTVAGPFPSTAASTHKLACVLSSSAISLSSMWSTWFWHWKASFCGELLLFPSQNLLGIPQVCSVMGSLHPAHFVIRFVTSPSFVIAITKQELTKQLYANKALRVARAINAMWL